MTHDCAVQDGDEFPITVRGALLLSCCLAAVALLIISGIVHGLVQLLR